LVFLQRSTCCPHRTFKIRLLTTAYPNQTYLTMNGTERPTNKGCYCCDPMRGLFQIMPCNGRVLPELFRMMAMSILQLLRQRVAWFLSWHARNHGIKFAEMTVGFECCGRIVSMYWLNYSSYTLTNCQILLNCKLS